MQKQLYLIKNSSYHLVNEEIKKLTADISNITTFSLNDVTIFDCLDDASYYGLFSEKRVIVIKDVKFFGGKFLYEDESNAIIRFTEHLDDDLILIFICDEIKKTKELTKKVISNGAEVIDIGVVDETTMVNILNEYASNHNLTIDKPAMELMIKNSAKNLDIALQELNKFSLVDNHITESIVRECGSIEDEDYTFDFSNAVVAKNFDKAFKLLDKLINDGVDGFALIGVLASSFSNMYMVKNAVECGLRDEDIAKIFGYSGTGRVYVLKKNSKIYTLDQLAEIIIELSDLDVKIKTGLNPVYGIKEFLLNL